MDTKILGLWNSVNDDVHADLANKKKVSVRSANGHEPGVWAE